MSIQKETNRKPSKRLKQAVSKLLQPDHSNVPECSTSAAAAKIIKGKTHQKKKSNPSDEPAKEANKVTKKIATKRRAQTNRLAKKKATAKLATVCQISSSESEEEENHTQMCNS